MVGVEVVVQSTNRDEEHANINSREESYLIVVIKYWRVILSYTIKRKSGQMWITKQHSSITLE